MNYFRKHPFILIASIAIGSIVFSSCNEEKIIESTEEVQINKTKVDISKKSTIITKKEPQSDKTTESAKNNTAKTNKETQGNKTTTESNNNNTTKTNTKTIDNNIPNTNNQSINEEEILCKNPDKAWSPDDSNIENEVIKPEDIIESGNLSKEQASTFVNGIPADNRSIKFFSNGTGMFLYHYTINGKEGVKEEQFTWEVIEKNKISINTTNNSKSIWKYHFSKDNKILTLIVTQTIRTEDYSEEENHKNVNIKFRSTLTYKK